MKIYGIYLIENILTGGNRRYVELMTGLMDKGHDVTVFAHKAVQKAFSPCNTVAVPVSLQPKKRISVQLARNLQAILQKAPPSKAECILVFGETDWLNAKILQKYSNTKNIVFCYRSDIIADNKATLTYEHLPLKKKARLYTHSCITRLRELDIAKKASHIIFQTENDKTSFLRRNKNAASKCCIVRNDILRPRFFDCFKKKNTSIRCKHLLFVGEYTKRKGFAFLVKALAILHRQDIDFICSVIARKEPPQNILHSIQEHNLKKRIVFLPPTDTVMPEMIQHDLVVVPSLFDSYPNVIMEAIHTGTPVIASNTSGMPYMLEYPELLFKTANPESIAHTIKKIISDSTYYLHIKELCCKRRSFFEFDWIQEWECILEGV